MMGKYTLHLRIFIYTILGVFILEGQVCAQNTGYIATNIESQMETQAKHKIINTETNRVISGVNFDYLEEGVYTLGVNDLISIDVMRHPEVSGQYIINKDGKIQYGFVGDILVAGYTKKEVKELLAETLSVYIVNPDVTVIITGYFSKVVFVVGEVGRPGKVFMKGDTITAREALIEANLPLLSGKLSKATIITPSDDGSPEIKNINVHKLLFKGDLRENYVMRPGDTLYIPPTVMAKAMRVIQPVTAPINQASSVYGF